MDREQRLESIMQGSVDDNEHIQDCLNTLENEPDDLIRCHARLWLEYNAIALARRLLGND